MIPSLTNSSSPSQQHQQQLQDQQSHQFNRQSVVEALLPFCTSDVYDLQGNVINSPHPLQHPHASIDLNSTNVRNSQFMPPERSLKPEAAHGPVMTPFNAAPPVGIDQLHNQGIPPAAKQHLLPSNARPSTNISYNAHQSLPHQYGTYQANVGTRDGPSHQSGSQMNSPQAQAIAAAAYAAEHGKLPNDRHPHQIDPSTNANVHDLANQSRQSLFYHYLQQPYNQQPHLQHQDHQQPLMIPTVLPYVFPPASPGPTAPATPRSGPYGPFWPDGVYIPYRPSAITSRHRDSPGPGFCMSPKTAQSHNNAHLYNAQAGVGVNVNQNVTGNVGIEHSHMDIQQPQTQRAPVDLIGQSGVAPPLASPPPAPSRVSWNQGQQFIPPNHKVYPPQGHVANNLAHNFHHDQQQQQQQQPLVNHPSPNPAQWDHRLLRHDSLPSQKISQARLNDAQQMGAPPSLSWQEPVQQRGYTFQQPVGINLSETAAPSTNASDSSQLSTLDYKDQLLSNAHSVYLDLLTWLQQSKRKDAALAAAGVGGGGKSKPNIYPRPPRPPGMDSASGKPQTQTKNHLRPVVTASGLPSPFENAISCLDRLSTMCVDSGWNWIDGMLVGGCLAYGLENYHKALRWYTRILEKYPSHVEALSNLAATFLALERREEALERWLQAVKLRPSYFEAVEHLIGLLCTNQRPQQAVEIVSFVQRSLRLDPDFVVPEEVSGRDKDYNSHLYLDNDADTDETIQVGFGSSGYAIPAADNGRMLALIHAKGNLLYSLGQNGQAASVFEDAILVAAGSEIRRHGGIQGLIRQIISGFCDIIRQDKTQDSMDPSHANDPPPVILAFPDSALQTVKLAFRPRGEIPGLKYVREGVPRRASTSTLSNSLLSLAKIYQDNIAAPTSGTAGSVQIVTVGDILALYYLSLSLQPSPSTANNVGILLSGIQQNATTRLVHSSKTRPLETPIPGVAPGSGVALALAYYHYGLHLDNNHAHLYTNLGSLLKDIGHLSHAIRQYENAVQCDGNFDIALANLANALKDSGRVNEAIDYYRRAVQTNPDFAEAVCGLSNALNSVCNWTGRGGIVAMFPNKSIVKNGISFCTIMQDRDRWHVNDQGLLCDSRAAPVGSGWIQRVVDIVDKQLQEGRVWGRGLLNALGLQQDPAHVLSQLGVNLMTIDNRGRTVADPTKNSALVALLRVWSEQSDWEGSRVLQLIERAIKYIGWLWYQDRYVHRKEYPASKYARPRVPAGLLPANAPTVLPFHTFTAPLSAKQIRQISQRNGLRISCSTLRSPWLPETVFCPPPPPQPCLNVGYVSSDFNNHPLAHLMQSVFGYHNPTRVRSFCYATSPSDGSIHRQKIEAESPVFRDVSSYSTDRLVQQIVSDGIHILVNLNGYTRGARNEVFAARPAPIHMSFMGFAGTLGAEWCDYILCDQLSIPLQTLSPFPRHLTFEQKMFEHGAEDVDDWVYGERIVFTKHSFFCCDHRQSSPDGIGSQQMTWEEELARRWNMRKKIFPNLPDDAIILGNFNQLYKIDPTTFRTWLRILAGIPNAVLWLLRFPEVGEHSIRRTALSWAGESIASRIVFTDVAPKQEHISRARVLDLCLDTPECNAHTTAADILWSGTPIITFPRYPYKMCSRMASSILNSALPQGEEGRIAASELIVSSDLEYEEHAVALGRGLKYDAFGRATGRLVELRRMLVMNRWENMLFDTRRWVDDLEDAYEAVWENWVNGEEGDIWLESRQAAILASKGDVRP